MTNPTPNNESWRKEFMAKFFDKELYLFMGDEMLDFIQAEIDKAREEEKQKIFTQLEEQYWHYIDSHLSEPKN